MNHASKITMLCWIALPTIENSQVVSIATVTVLYCNLIVKNIYFRVYWLSGTFTTCFSWVRQPARIPALKTIHLRIPWTTLCRNLLQAADGKGNTECHSKWTIWMAKTEWCQCLSPFQHPTQAHWLCMQTMSSNLWKKPWVPCVCFFLVSHFLFLAVC